MEAEFKGLASATGSGEGVEGIDHGPLGTPNNDVPHDTAENTPAEPAGEQKKKKRKKKKKTQQQQGAATADEGGGGIVNDGLDDDIDADDETKMIPPPQGPVVDEVSASRIAEIQKAMQMLATQQQLQLAPKSEEEAKKKAYEFWSTQPVPKLDDQNDDKNEPIEQNKETGAVRQDPYSLPSRFVWDTLNLDNADILYELYNLLNENYVEDDDNMFRFNYSEQFLLWALKPPGWSQDWHCGVRVANNGKLVGFISAVPASIRIYEHQQKMVEINFLCVHKKLRSKRMAPVLIREITRRVNIRGLFQAVYTAGVVLPKPVATCRYWHRSLNPKKLIDVKFSHLSRNMTISRVIKLYKLPEEPVTLGLRPLTAKDCGVTCHMLNEYLSRFHMVPVFTEVEFKHWFLPRDGIINSYVVESPKEKGKITDFFSFYTLPSTIMHHPNHSSLRAAYSFYSFHTVTELTVLIQDALILARMEDFDVFNALDVMENKTFLDKLKFGIGDGNLQYYIYNWRCPSMDPDKVGLVLQ